MNKIRVSIPAGFRYHWVSPVRAEPIGVNWRDSEGYLDEQGRYVVNVNGDVRLAAIDDAGRFQQWLSMNWTEYS